MPKVVNTAISSRLLCVEATSTLSGYFLIITLILMPRGNTMVIPSIPL